MTPRVSIVILTFNARHWLELFLPKVLATTYANYEIILADNCSTDDSVAFVREKFPAIRCVCFPENHGFARGNNHAIPHAQGDYVVLLNNDVEVTPDWLNPLVEFLEAHPDAAACQPKILSYRERNHFEYAGAAGGFIDRHGYAFCRGRFFDNCEEDRGQYDQIREVFWATGACLCLRRSAWEKVGPLDGDFFAHMEEIDWCWRARLHGYRLFCLPQSVVYHVGGGSLNRRHPLKAYLNYRNNLIMLQKNLSAGRAWRILVFRLVLDHISLYRHLARGHYDVALGILKAHWHFLIQQRRWLRLRRANQEAIRRARPDVSFTLGNDNVVYQRNIVFDVFLRKKKTFPELGMNAPSPK